MRSPLLRGNIPAMMSQSHDVIFVLITRPEPQASALAKRLDAEFGSRLSPLISPLLAPHYYDDPLPEGPFGALILTAQTALGAPALLRALGRKGRVTKGGLLPQYALCVGAQTTRAARTLGFKTINAQGDAAALIKTVAAHSARAPFLHLLGRESTGDICGALNRLAIACTQHIVYAQEPQPLSAAAIERLSLPAPLIVPLYSPRSAQLFVSALNAQPYKAELRFAAISENTAAILPLELKETCALAQSPDSRGMLEAINTLI